MAIEAEALTYRYPGAGEPVLRGLDFAIVPGEIFGFLGPNGSGKTTTQKLLARLLAGYGGSVRVFGQEVAEQPPAYFERIGVCFEAPNLYEKLTARENLEFYRGFFDGETTAADDLLRRLDLPANDRRPVSQYSKGMKMRVVLARSLVNQPDLWFLDEPTAGQDPAHAVAIRELIREEAAGGAAVFLTTHDMSVADSLCDRVAFLADGVLASVGSPHDLRLAHRRNAVRVEVRDGDARVSREFSLDDDAEKEAFLALVRDQPVETIHTLEPSLEDVFLAVTGRRLDDGSAA
jgi:fluoroquinolone transport system ATP-binding protein